MLKHTKMSSGGKDCPHCGDAMEQVVCSDCGGCGDQMYDRGVCNSCHGSGINDIYAGYCESCDSYE